MVPDSHLVLSLLIFYSFCPLSYSILAVQNNEVRDASTLDGLWTFVMEPNNGGDQGLAAGWQLRDLDKFPNVTVMPVPCAYNDLTADANIRDHIGWVWYQKKEYVNKRDEDSKIVLRFGSVNYYSIVWVNGKEVGSHTGGHVPFQFDISKLIRFGEQNKITVAVNNTLSWATIPQGDFNYQPTKSRKVGGRTLSRLPDGAFKDVGNFDFFNYAGILRSVHLLRLHHVHISDIRVVAEHLGSFYYDVYLSSKSSDYKVKSRIMDPEGNTVFAAEGPNVKGAIKSVKPWWPRGMGNPHLYSIEVALVSMSDGVLVDLYRETFGFRTVSWTGSQILINDKPFYCLGFGMHEDSEIHGRGFDQAVMTKDLNLLEWMGGNCYRTSHYPYAEERIAEGDRRGIAVVLETPAVGLKGFPKANNLLHLKMVEEMIERDKNHPSVFMWSLANEPHTERKESRAYFKSLIDYAHALDNTRPVTIVYGPTNFDNDQTADMIDVVCVNRYYGWYIDMGHLDWVNQSVYWDISLWKDTFKKPIMVTEYGADSLPGLNTLPSVDFSEQYQDDILTTTHQALDALRSDHALAGEMVWNFADFMTGMSTTRAVGNHKGVFTRTRQAKTSAYSLRKRYLKRFDQRNLPLWD